MIRWMIVHVLVMREVRSLGDQGGSRPILLIFRWIIVPIAPVSRLILLRVLVEEVIRSRLRPGPSVGEVGRFIVRDDVAIRTSLVFIPVRPLLRRVVGVMRRTGNRFLIRLLVVIGPIGFRLVVPEDSNIC